ncbi:MAG: hypothetical protein Q9221_005982 [Calogaya cf. arnoldii]
MLDCKACISRCIRTIFADVLHPIRQLRLQRQLLPVLNKLRLSSTAERAYHSARPTQPRLSRHDGLQNRRRPEARHQTTQAISADNHFYTAPPQSKTSSLTKVESVEFKKKKHLDRELVYLRDPVKLAEKTITLLRNDDAEKALDLVRQASRSTSCTMKKRAQKPDAQTYTILLRGLSWHSHLQDSLPLALKIYHSMFAENCPVKPNIIHTNTVLKVCALARDMDALWGVAAKLPPKGMAAPNNLTFTTILNAIRVVAWNNDKDLGDEQWEEKSLRRQRAVIQGRKIWEEIIPRWRAGDIWIDEELVCAMGRLLLLGSTERDHDDILSLLQQVMALPRQKRPLGEPQEIPPPVSLGTTEAEGPVVNDDSQGEPSQLEVYDNHVENHGEDNVSSSSTPIPVLNTELANVFRPKPSAPSVSIPRPGRNTLSLVLDACIHLRAIPSAQAYWGLLTDPSGPYNVTPDSENYHMYLRLLRLQRASHATSELINEMYSGELKSMQLLKSKTFRIAFSACLRDRNNPNSIEHAAKILNIMYKSLPEPDFPALEMFIELAASQTLRDYRITLNALRETETGMRLVRNYINFGSEDAPVDDRIQTAAIGLAKRLIGLYDKVRSAAGDRLEPKEKSQITSDQAALSLWVGRKTKQIRESERDAGRTLANRPMPNGKFQVRKARTDDHSQREHDRVLAERAKKGMGVGVRKRALRAQAARDGSGEFEDFE